MDKNMMVKEISCEECNARINASVDYYVDEATVAGVVADFQNSDFCGTEDVEKCMQALEYVIPIALSVFESDRAWVGNFCSNTLMCA